jgi:HK97 family phage prohead protease
MECMSVVDLSDLFVKPVKGHEDIFAFQFDFVPEGKALDDGTQAQVVTETENGDLIIEGWAAVFDGQDRQNENFTDGAFKAGIKSFLEGQSSLCFHHKHDHGIGKVLELEEVEGKGLRMKARVDHQPESSPLRYIYNAVKKGTYNALSVGGFFKRKLTEAGYKIGGVDFTEISVTPVPVHPGTNFAVVAGKALRDMPSVPDAVAGGGIREEDERSINWMIEELEATFARIEQAIGKRTEATA